MKHAPKLRPGQRCHCGCGKRAVAAFLKSGKYYGSYACATMAQRLATEPHDTAEDGLIRFRYVPAISELESRGFIRVYRTGSANAAERWLMPAECKGGKKARFYVDRFRGTFIATRAYVCYSKVDFEALLTHLAGLGDYAPLHQNRCQPRTRNKQSAASEITDEEIANLHPEVLKMVKTYILERRIGTSLSRMAQLGYIVKFKRIKPGGRSGRVCYGVHEWLGADGKPLPEHRHRLVGYKRI